MSVTLNGPFLMNSKYIPQVQIVFMGFLFVCLFVCVCVFFCFVFFFWGGGLCVLLPGLFFCLLVCFLPCVWMNDFITSGLFHWYFSVVSVLES